MKDKIVERVVSEFRKRSAAGIKKYNTTLEDNNHDCFVTHLKEELQDGILYLTKIQNIIESTPNDKELGETIRRMFS